MEIKQLKNRTHFSNSRAENLYRNLNSLLNELRLQKLSSPVISFINEQIELINTSHEERAFRKQLRIGQHKILKKVEKEHKIVPKNYYRNLWMILGMSTFGIPMGAAFGASIGNMGLLGIGLPIGMAIGIAVGMTKDNKAAKDGKQLNFDLSTNKNR